MHYTLDVFNILIPIGNCCIHTCRSNFFQAAIKIFHCQSMRSPYTHHAKLSIQVPNMVRPITIVFVPAYYHGSIKDGTVRNSTFLKVTDEHTTYESPYQKTAFPHRAPLQILPVSIENDLFFSSIISPLYQLGHTITYFSMIHLP